MDYFPIEGTVTDADAYPLEGATVMVEEGDWPTPDIAAVTDEEGRFTLYDLRPGRYLLRVVFEDAYLRVPVRAGPDGRAIRIRLPLY